MYWSPIYIMDLFELFEKILSFLECDLLFFFYCSCYFKSILKPSTSSIATSIPSSISMFLLPLCWFFVLCGTFPKFGLYRPYSSLFVLMDGLSAITLVFFFLISFVAFLELFIILSWLLKLKFIYVLFICEIDNYYYKKAYIII